MFSSSVAGSPSYIPPSSVPLPIPLSIDKGPGNRAFITALTTIDSQPRNNRTGNARRAVSQPDHDILEGLPIRRWHRKAVNANTAPHDNPDSLTVSSYKNGFPEHYMPTDSHQLPEYTQAMLVAARLGLSVTKYDTVQEIEPGHAERAENEEKPSLLIRKWSLFARHFEPKEPEHLAKRRKGLRSLYGGSTAPINTSSQMRKIKIRNVDSEGNSQIVEALVPEGQVVDAEIVAEELTSPTQALAPGTKVEGVGVANAEGVLISEEQVAPPIQRRKPPLPKRRLKGPGRDRNKKVAFTSGVNGAIATGESKVVDDNAQKSVDGDTTNGAKSAGGDNEGEDSMMQDAGQDGDEGSDEGSEGEEGDREDREISATPAPSLESLQAQVLVTKDAHFKTAIDPRSPAPSAPSTMGDQGFDKALCEQRDALLKEEPVLDPANESDNGLRSGPSVSITTELIVQGELNTTKLTGEPDSDAHAMSIVHPSSIVDMRTEPLKETLAPSVQTKAVLNGEDRKRSDIPDPLSQHSFEALEERQIRPPPDSANLPPKPPPLLQPDLTPASQDSALSSEPQIAERQEPHTVQTIEAPPADSSLSSLPVIQAQPSKSAPPPYNPSEIAAEIVVPPPESVVPNPPPSYSADTLTSPASTALATAVHPELWEVSQPLTVKPCSAAVEHHTPKAPTLSPPTPIATSFDAHHREKLMESPRAPTMSPPTPARDLSSSPDLPLAGYGGPPLLALDSATEQRIPGLGQQLLPREERADGEAAPTTPETFAVEIPHEHNPLDGLTAPKISCESGKEDGEEPKTFPDGEEDLLGNFEKSLGS